MKIELLKSYDENTGKTVLEEIKKRIEKIQYQIYYYRIFSLAFYNNYQTLDIKNLHWNDNTFNFTKIQFLDFKIK